MPDSIEQRAKELTVVLLAPLGGANLKPHPAILAAFAAVRADALEEAARVAERLRCGHSTTWRRPTHDPDVRMVEEKHEYCADIATFIRSLSQKGQPASQKGAGDGE